MITKVTLKLVPVPVAQRFAAVRYAGFEGALETVRRGLIAGVRPAVVRIYDPTEASAKHARFAQDAGWLLVLVFDGDERLIATQEEIMLDLATSLGGESLGPEPAVHWEQRRFNWSWFTDAVDHEGIAEAIEVTATWSELPGLYERLKKAVSPHMQEFMAHVSHVYDQGAALYTIVRGEYADDAAGAGGLRRHLGSGDGRNPGLRRPDLASSRHRSGARPLDDRRSSAPVSTCCATCRRPSIRPGS